MFSAQEEEKCSCPTQKIQVRSHDKFPYVGTPYDSVNITTGNGKIAYFWDSPWTPSPKTSIFNISKKKMRALW
jgi:hypothetical protein